MTMQTTMPSVPSAQVVGNAFVEQYYHILHHSPEMVHRFYLDTSALSRPESDGVLTTVTTMKGINDKICSFDYKNYKAEIKTADAQDSYKDGVIVLVTGCLTGKDNLKKKFTQTFFLAPQDKGYYVLNDVFRYICEIESDTSVGEIIGVDDTSQSNSLTPDPEPTQVLDPPNLNQATSQTEGVEIVEEKADDQVNDEMQVSNDVDIPVVVESHLEKNHISTIAESAMSSSSQENAPKKSYASIIISQSKKGPTKVYVPANTLRVAPIITEKQSINSVAPASSPEPSNLTAPVNEPESHDTEDEVEGHSIYIRNLPLYITVAQLESEFKKFGPIKKIGVQVRRKKQQGFCFGFVEFQEFSSMQRAIQINKSDYKLFKREGCKHYHTLGEIFSGTTAIEALGSASTQLLNTSEEERQLEDDFLNRGVHVTAENDDEVNVVSNTRPHNKIGTSGEQRRKEPKVSKSDKLKACMAQWSSTVSLRNEETEPRTLYLKEKFAKIQGKGSCQSDNEVTSPDPYSNVTCLDILNNMEGVSNEVYMKAIKAFKDPDFRVSFVKMPVARRGSILELL
ncbi:ras GTPase-activating protein-binding protein 2-like isoform X2 [Olea europaea var. sylvestris]|nr:ras GTPase-activating protein-binding protein 2-like isoform X2 [Olea europaea var. sylvestris]XP_022860086.1 ras GTPase-activating protein-binding protein 2-like isoform X2 [Olea europaea var. sylvestris]